MKAALYRRIAVAVDGSPRSQAALDHALRLALLHGARLRIIHVVEEVGPYMPNVHSAEEYWRAMRQAGTAILDRARRRAAAAGLRAETKLVVLPAMGTLVRHTAEALVREAKRFRADLLVVGTHGRRGVRRLLLGSVAESVTRGASMPVLLVRRASA